MMAISKYNFISIQRSLPVITPHSTIVSSSATNALQSHWSGILDTLHIPMWNKEKSIVKSQIHPVLSSRLVCYWVLAHFWSRVCQRMPGHRQPMGNEQLEVPHNTFC